LFCLSHCLGSIRVACSGSNLFLQFHGPWLIISSIKKSIAELW
jgi:hypothetical protein